MDEDKLIEITMNYFKPPCMLKIGVNKKALEAGHKLPMNELEQILSSIHDIELQKYYNSILLIKLYNDAPTKRFDLYMKGVRLLNQAPEYKFEIGLICDSILANEISEYENVEELMR